MAVDDLIRTHLMLRASVKKQIESTIMITDCNQVIPSATKLLAVKWG
jgi:hypothetical protein